MKKYFFPLLMAAAAMLTSCNKEAIRGSGSSSTKVIALPSFHAVESQFDIAANISYGATQEVSVSGYNNLLDILDLEVNNGVLKLKYDSRYNNIRNGNLVANIKIPTLSRIANQGSKNMEVKDFWQLTQLNASLYGTGDIRIKECAMNVLVSDVYGSGNVEAKGAECLQLQANVYGNGHTSATVINKIVARIFGSGNVYYLGNASIDVERQGSGRVIKL
jgi:hypothetical protein